MEANSSNIGEGKGLIHQKERPGVKLTENGLLSTGNFMEPIKLRAMKTEGRTD